MDANFENLSLKAGFMSRILRWSEYGSACLAILGTFLAVLNSQIAFASMPITLSLLLNLWRRSYGDRLVLQRQGQTTQTFVHRYESVVEELRRERSHWLLEHAGMLTARDYIQLLAVLDFRFECLVEKTIALQEFVEESSQYVMDELQSLQDEQIEQYETYELILDKCEEKLRLGLDYQSLYPSVSELWERLNWINTALMTWEEAHASATSKLYRPMAELEQQLSILIERWTAYEDNIRTGLIVDGLLQAKLEEVGGPVRQGLLDKIQQLQQQIDVPDFEHESEVWQESKANLSPLENFRLQVQSVNHRLTKQQKFWNDLYRSGQDKIVLIKNQLEQFTQQLENQYQTLSERPAVSVQNLSSHHHDWSAVSVLRPYEDLQLDFTPYQSALNHVQSQLERTVQDLEHDWISFRLQPFQETLVENLDQIQLNAQALFQKNCTDTTGMVLTPLLQHLSDCDEKLATLLTTPQGMTWDHSVQALSISTDNLEAHIEQIQLLCFEEQEQWNNLHSQLLMMRSKAEALSSQILIEIEHIPSLVEACFQRLGLG